MVSIANQTAYMLSRNDDDFPFSTEPSSSNMFSQELYGCDSLQGYNMDAQEYNFSRTSQDSYLPFSGLSGGSLFPEMTQSFVDGKHSPHLYPDDSSELRPPPSSLSTASGPSASSSAISSPYSNHGHTVPLAEWTTTGLGIQPGIVSYDSFAQDPYFSTSGLEHEYPYPDLSKPHVFVDPLLIHQYTGAPSQPPASGEMFQPLPHSLYPPPSPTPSQHSSYSSRPVRRSASPYIPSYQSYPYPPLRRPSLVSQNSYGSQDGSFDSDELREKGRCPNADCGKVFKDLKAHMLTHQNERPEKCPIATCDYHIKGFARKYDKNRHTLTHYKGTMVCGFCPGSGTPLEKSFNRADVFKRHLTTVHAVEQTAPNSRKKTSGGINAGKKLSGYHPDATGKCSTCSIMFNNAQDFYEHLDDCVLRVVQQEEPSEAINQRRLAEVENDANVHSTLERNGLPTNTVTYSASSDEDEEEVDDAEDDDYTVRGTKSRRGGAPKGTRVSPTGSVQKSRANGTGLTFSKGGMPLHSKGRKKRKDYPSSWGCSTSQMKLKKRTMCAFDGTRRLWKDDLMLSSEFEVRIPLADPKYYVTDLDVQSMRKMEAVHDATVEEKGPWEGEGRLEALMEVKKE